jgi:hypothetical protein
MTAPTVTLSHDLFRLIEDAMKWQAEWARISTDKASKERNPYQHRRSVSEAFERYAEYRRKTQAEFARRQGWTVSQTSFSLAQLTSGRIARSRDSDWLDCGNCTQLRDHSEWYRRNRRPVALVSHTYLDHAGVDYHRGELPPGLSVIILPCPSWYHPETLPILIVRSPPPMIFAAPNAPSRPRLVILPFQPLETRQ